MEAPLTPPISLYANPAAYDYLHEVRLLAANVIEMAAGDGQKMYFKAVGRFRMAQQSDEIKFSIHDIQLFDAYDDSRLELEIQDFECSATVENGDYFLPDGLPNASVSERKQFLSFDRRFVFDVDPILLAGREKGTPIPKTFDASERVYYDMSECRRGTMAQLTRPRLILPDTY